MEIQHFYDTIIEIKHDIMIVSGIINIRSAESEESLSGAREDLGDRTYSLRVGPFLILDGDFMGKQIN